MARRDVGGGLYQRRGRGRQSQLADHELGCLIGHTVALVRAVGGAVEPDVLRLIGPKNEATASLRKILDGITDELTGLRGTQRHELIAAAHTIIAVTAVFDGLRKEIGEDFDQLEITDRKRFRILLTKMPQIKTGASAIPSLTWWSVPAPTSTRGFYENLRGPLNQFISKAAFDIRMFTAQASLATTTLKIDRDDALRH